MSVNKSVIVTIIIGIVLVGGILAYFQNTNFLVETSKEPIKIGIVKWVSNDQYDQNILAFKSTFDQNGYVEGDNIEYLVDISNAKKSKQREIIQGFIDKKVDLIYTLTTPGTLIAKEMTQDIPIVFSIVTYPVEAGIIEGLEHSGNNLVGTRNYVPIETQFDFFNEIFPIKKLGFVHRLDEPNSKIQFEEAKEYGKAHGIEVVDIAGTSLENLELLISEKITSVDSLYQACDTLIQGGGELIAIKIAIENKKPSFSCNKDGVKMGAVAGKVADFSELGKLSGSKALKILDGQNIDNIKTEGPKTPYVIVNSVTAESLGIKFSDGFQYGVREFIRET